MKYIVIGGVPHDGYRGQLTFTGMNRVGVYRTQEEADAVKENYDKCSGLGRGSYV